MIYPGQKFKEVEKNQKKRHPVLGTPDKSNNQN